MRRCLTVVALGIAFGAATSVVNGASSPYAPLGAHFVGTDWAWMSRLVSFWLDAGWSWAAVAVAAGWLIKSGYNGAAAAGAASLIAAVCSYYTMDMIVHQDSVSTLLSGELAFWCGVSVLLGPPLGVVGQLGRRADGIGLVARLAAPVGAAVQMALWNERPNGLVAEPPQAAWAKVVVWVVSGIVILCNLALYAWARRQHKGSRANTVVSRTGFSGGSELTRRR
jgi:hypothetical protein